MTTTEKQPIVNDEATFIVRTEPGIGEPAESKQGIPNNNRLPYLLYKSVFELPERSG
ncbi:MAG: hypothetical protein QM664_07255 [Flavihumibacter sp.]